MSFLSSLFGGGAQPAPTITPPAAVPTYNSTSVQAAGQRQLVRRSGGRASTVLSLNSNDNSTKTASAALLGQ